MRHLTLLLLFPLFFVFSCGSAGNEAEKPDYAPAEKIHREAMEVEKQIEALLPAVDSALAAGRDTASLKALVVEFRDYQKMIPEIPGSSHDHGHDHGHDHAHDHDHDHADPPSVESMVAVQQEYKTKMEELLKRFQAVR
jgi:ABC-type Zn2+ transport system substrate-binding protein/surface adhesin